MDEQQERQFDKDLDAFTQRPEWFSYFSKPHLELLIERTHQRIEKNDGYSSISAFEISFNELVASGSIVKLRVVDVAEDEPEPFSMSVAEYRQTPSATIQRRYRQEPRYRDAVDRLFATGAV